jgi:hypothetical protein
MDGRPVELATFRSLFTGEQGEQGEVRVMLDWTRLGQLATAGLVHVHRLALTPGHDLSLLFAPWYRTPSRGDVAWDTAGARPYSIAEVVADGSGLGAAHRAKIAGIRRAMRTLATVGPLAVPTYAVGAGRELVLDGNHRLAALAGDADLWRRAQVERYVVTGPVTADLLPDLRHWARRG